MFQIVAPKTPSTKAEQGKAEKPIFISIVEPHDIGLMQLCALDHLGYGREAATYFLVINYLNYAPSIPFNSIEHNSIK